MNLPIDIINYLISFLTNLSVTNLIITDSTLYNIFKIYVKSRIIKDKFNDVIVEVFGGIDTFVKYPTIRWNNRYLGNTGYIDNIDLNDLSSPITIGIDNNNRPFIVLRLENVNNKKKNIIIDILFQRFSDWKNLWASSTIGKGKGIIRQSGPVLLNNKIQDIYFKKNIRNLLSNSNYIEDSLFIESDYIKVKVPLNLL